MKKILQAGFLMDRLDRLDDHVGLNLIDLHPIHVNFLLGNRLRLDVFNMF